MDFKKEYHQLSQKQQYLLIACGVGIIGCFMPWVEFPRMGSVRGVAMNGKYALILFGTILYFLLNRDRQTPLDETLEKRFMFLGGASGLLTLYHLLFDNLEGGFLFVTYSGSHGLGLYIVFAASVAIIAIIKKMEEVPNER